MIIILDKENRIIYFNLAAKSLLNTKPQKAFKKDLFQYLPDLKPVIQRMDQEEKESNDFRINQKVYDVRISPIRNLFQRKFQILVLRDITALKGVENNLFNLNNQLEQKIIDSTKELIETNQAINNEIKERQRAEKLLRDSLLEKEVLIKEIHHRVKNNLQIIISLIKLRARNIQQTEMQEIFHETQNRIRTIGMIYEKLYKSQDLSQINMAAYIKDLAHLILYSYGHTDNRIKISINIEFNYIDIDSSILCGLITNEAITNSLKHAFPDNRHGNIDINFKYNSNNTYEIYIKDNGIGLDKDKNFHNTNTLGFKIIDTLVKQLDGKIDLIRNNGFGLKIIFPQEPIPEKEIKYVDI